MLKSILAALVLLLVAFGAYVASQPAVGTVERSAVLPAPPEAVFGNINDLHKWEAWSPWAKADPDAKLSYSGPASGVGASMAWVGNTDVGEGRMTIVESKPNETAKLRLDFVKPFTSTSTATFTLHPEGAGTRATWSMTGERPFLVRAVCILLRGDKMVGDMFDKGLEQLGRVSASKP